MILGIGTDIVEIKRVANAIIDSDRLAMRVLTEFEQKEYLKSNDKARYLAKKFAAKEALAKAIGTGIGRGISWHNFEIDHDENGKPVVNVIKGAKEWCDTHKVDAIHLSISDEVNYATATAIFESK